MMVLFALVSFLAFIVFLRLTELPGSSKLLPYTWLTIGYFLTVFLLFRQIRIIRLTKENSVLSFPVFTFFRKTIVWRENDFYITIDEHSQGGPHEAVWIVRNEKVIERFSSFYYSNYKELKKHLPIEYKGKIHVGAFSQVYYLFGGRFKK